MAWQRKRDGQGPLALTIALSYGFFLLLCFVLGVFLYHNSTSNARDNFWHQHSIQLENAVETMDSYMVAMDNYTRQLLNDSTFVRFSHMEGFSEYGYMMTAYYVKNTLASRLFSLGHVPVENVSIYLKKMGYIISGSQFTEAEQYYRAYRNLAKGRYEEWTSLLENASGEGKNADLSLFTRIKDDVMFVRDIDDILPRNVPAVIWFEWQTKRVQDLFFSEDISKEAILLAIDTEGKTQWLFGGSKADLTLADRFTRLEYSPAGYAALENMHVMKVASAQNSWQYMLALPTALCDEALGNHDMLFIAMLVLAALGGVAIVALMVRRNIRPIVQLGTQLKQAEGDREQLKQVMAAQRPAVCADYVRRLLSGHISSEEEFAYIMRFLELDGPLNYYVLFCVTHDRSNNGTLPDVGEILANALPAYLTTARPMYYYTLLDQASQVVLVAYDETVKDPRMDLQHRVLRLHDELLAEYSLWFFAGVGKMCTQPIHLWESYEQARTAARYTAKHHVFLPYEVMQKDSQAVYYPIEISAKFLHFITSGNKAQVSQLFSLIYEENIQDRSLPLNRLNFLLSDIRNTLLRARFSVNNQEDNPQMIAIDHRLNQTMNFAQCESVALSLCDFFREMAEPGDPVPEIEKYLQENYADPSMCLTKLSDRFHISESYLSHLFKEKNGQNFSVYLENLRLNEAERRLTSKDCDLSTLYLDLGYNNAASFRRAFKKRYGITPSAMREQ